MLLMSRHASGSAEKFVGTGQGVYTVKNQLLGSLLATKPPTTKKRRMNNSHSLKEIEIPSVSIV